MRACSFILLATLKINWPNEDIHPLALAKNVGHQSKIKKSIISQVKTFPQVSSRAAGVARNHKDPPMKAQGISGDQHEIIAESIKK
ncbi:hypothetical protein [Prochlorococcus marinus]|uniref:Uncharacterized protein n=1 Tax=Prochlorococcus marinus (strain MIT 9303) TaxID=59922 RepID=A2C789_PROM3|nr:hypothetical protein [Prochlorococcus marinus]ABM77349.1 Hypothetical protein P9303_05971 [Prochlorococcus marinus str. MIT 9303]